MSDESDDITRRIVIAYLHATKQDDAADNLEAYLGRDEGWHRSEPEGVQPVSHADADVAESLTWARPSRLHTKPPTRAGSIRRRHRGLAALVERRGDDADRQDRQHARNSRIRRAVPRRASRLGMVPPQPAAHALNHASEPPIGIVPAPGHQVCGHRHRPHSRITCTQVPTE